MELLAYSRTEWKVRFDFNRMLRKGINDKSEYVPRKDITLDIVEIPPERACEIANTSWPSFKRKYIVKEGEVVSVEI